MLELPEILTLAKDLNREVSGAAVAAVLPPVKPHKFCWFSGDPQEYAPKLLDAKISGAEGFGIYLDLVFDNGFRLCVNDGVNVRLGYTDKLPANYQLCIVLSDGRALVLTVAMYGGIVLHQSDYDNKYYAASKNYVSPFSADFEGHFYKTLHEAKPTLSVKELLATGQRFAGLGNGCLQDILFIAGINPRRKAATLEKEEQQALARAVAAVLGEMTKKGGRDTEKNLYGQSGGYRTLLSAKTWQSGCPKCGGDIVKQAYLGGSVYFCPVCQPQEKTKL